MTSIKVTAQKSILKTKFLELHEAHILKKDKSTAIFHNVSRTPAVLVLPLTEKHEVYLISQYRYLYNKRVLEAVAGYIEQGETSLAAAKRELREEAGLVANQWEEILRTEIAASSIKATMHIFLARGLDQVAPEREDTEDIEVVKIPLVQAAQKAAMGEIHDSTSVAGVLLLDKLKKEKKI